MEEEKDITRLERFERYRLTMKSMMYHNFMGGMAWAVGATLGLALIVTIGTILLNYLNPDPIPVIGEFIKEILTYVTESNALPSN